MRKVSVGKLSCLLIMGMLLLSGKDVYAMNENIAMEDVEVESITEDSDLIIEEPGDDTGIVVEDTESVEDEPIVCEDAGEKTTIEFMFDYDALLYNTHISPQKTDSNIQDYLRNPDDFQIKPFTWNNDSVRFDYMNSGLSYISGNSAYGVGGETEYKTDKNYALRLKVYGLSDILNNVNFDNQLMSITAITDIQIKVNGSINEDVLFGKNQINGSYNMYIPLPGSVPTNALVYRITTLNDTFSIQKGTSALLKYNIYATDDANKAVSWTITGSSNPNTKVTTANELFVASDETAQSITVKCTSVQNSKISGEYTVYISSEPQEISTLKIVDPPTQLIRGAIIKLNVKAEGSQINKDFVWQIQYNESANTRISYPYGETSPYKAYLEIGSDETALAIKVSAYSVMDDSKYDFVDIEIKDKYTMKKLKLSYDLSTVDYDIHTPEYKINEKVRSGDILSIDTTGAHLDDMNNWFMKKSGNSYIGIGDGTDGIDSSASYAMGYHVWLDNEYEWPQIIREMPNFSEKTASELNEKLTINVNGKKCTDFIVRYNTSYPNSLTVYVPINGVIPTNKKSHTYKTTSIDKATPTKNGANHKRCMCRSTKDEIIYYPKTITLTQNEYKYTGKQIKPGVTVTGANSKTIADSNYKVSYGTNTEVGTGTVKIDFTGKYYSGSVTKKFKIIGLPKPVNIKELKNEDKDIKVIWSKDSKAKGYYIYRSVNGASAAKIATVEDGSTTSYKDTKATENGKKYSYYIVAYYTLNGSKKSVDKGKTVTTYRIPATKVKSLSNVSSGIKITWEENKYATGYEIHRSENCGDYKKIKTYSDKSNVTYTDKSVENGKKYSYRIYVLKKVNDVIYYNKSGSVKTDYRMETSKISSAKNTAAGKITVKWSKNGKATGYEIEYATGSSKKSVDVPGAATVSKVISGLKKGSKYTIRVRSYKKDGNVKYYSDWSPKVTVNVTK